MEFYIDPTKVIFEIIQNQDPFSLLWYFMKHGAWSILLVGLIWGAYITWLDYKQRNFLTNEVKYTLFAVDIPKQSEQTVRAVEEIFNHLHGVKSGPIAKEEYVMGMSQLWLSFEIVSIEGYIQFLIRTPSKFNDIVKSVFYAHYPDAEITEVEDYMDLIPQNTNNIESKFKGFGMDFFLAKPNFLPIKTYPSFENSLTQTYIDPLASFLEILGKVGPGEFLGMTLLIRPVDADDVIAAGKKEVAKIMGRAMPSTKTLMDNIIGGVEKGIDRLSEEIYELWGDVAEKTEKDQLKVLTPNERERLKAIDTKIGKYLYQCILRTLYIAPKERFSIGRALYGLQGAFRQFADWNSFKNSKTKADYFFKRQREEINVQRFIKRFTKRNTFDTPSFILNSEEIASIYHFPDINVKAPLIKRTETKTVQPPTGLPFEEYAKSELINYNKDEEKESSIDKKLEEGNIIDLNLENKYFESKFAKDKTEKEDYEKEFIKNELEKKEKEIFNNRESTKPEIISKNNTPLPDFRSFTPNNSNLKDEETKTNNNEISLNPPTNLPFVD